MVIWEKNINVRVDLATYTTKTDLKSVTHVDVSNLELKSNLASLKTAIDKIAVDKLKTVPVDLSKLSNVVNNDVVKKTVYDKSVKLVAKVNNVDTTGFVLKTKYDTRKSDLEKKIRDAEKGFITQLDLLKKQIIILKLLK